ncbi:MULTISPECIES: N-acetylmuramic acid 6-phosphate etherase [Alteromonas]|mgnify:FL=1|uniref:N-acetylmuramic acid 6-phosphate etherase n=1 Tax=Alteromonas TaxID=226 RepID=UPI00144875EF|nr:MULTISPECIES: N-acetylmuramic acid 6-phosphate etherase [unclassified Alteromonas]MED5488080.1 N-acetylmuramic acid 6-phosphate etherase [Pseudomonadota bacterium]NKX21503.1 N-acetylmuramic acid 6-phosphate etherase [Alteromonadaceae bacterium A_SAG2]NKX31382.1 N-acetylmuramic acid 6-phosphate etherase [Alteromonadaceae bacterium A_SAG1]
MSSHNSSTSESSANASIKNTVSTDNEAAGNKPTVNELAQSLNKIVSEGRNPDTLDIDTLSTEGILTRINNEDAKVANAVTSQIPQIGKAVDAATISIKNGGRLIYIGAGTSGRLGILDAVECRPTFSVPDELVVGVIAGGEKAIQHAVEGAEDDVDAGRADLVALSLNHNDTVIGISASGRTPYVSGALEYARSLGCFTGAIACSPNAAIFTHADVAICPVVGPEALTGSTRMKSGTAQKLILNMISTSTMIKLGKTYQNLMVDVNATNEKLKARALRIVMQATDCSENAALAALSACNNKAKVAILMVLTGQSAEQAAAQLDASGGYLRSAVNKSE